MRFLALKQIGYIALKDIYAEYSNRYRFNGLLVFAIFSVCIFVFALKGSTVNKEVGAGLLWVLIFFCGMAGLSRSFVSEIEKGTYDTLRLLSASLSIFLGKVCVNTLLLFPVACVISILFLVLFPTFTGLNIISFSTFLFVGSLSIAITATFLAALVAKAESRGTLYTVLSVPPLLPVILSTTEATMIILEGGTILDSIEELWILIGYILTIGGVSTILFDTVWKE